MRTIAFTIQRHEIKFKLEKKTVGVKSTPQNNPKIEGENSLFYYYNIIGSVLCSDVNYFEDEINELVSSYSIANQKKEKSELLVYGKYKEKSFTINLFQKSNVQIPRDNEILSLFKQIFAGLENKQKFIAELKDPYLNQIYQIYYSKLNKKELKDRSYYSSQSSNPFINNIREAEFDSKSASKHRKFEEEKDLVYQTTSTNNISGGLQNLGNTCYLNSIIQILKSLNSFRKILSNSNTSSALLSLFNQMDSSSTVRPDKFVQKIRVLNPNFGDSRPHDSKEFFIFLIKQLNDEGISTDSIFAWVSVKSLKFSCRHEIKVNEKFILITLPKIDFNSAIISAFKKKTRNEINSYPQFFCDQCNAEKRCDENKEIISIPKYAIFYREPNPRYIESLSSIQEIRIENFLLVLRGIVLLHPLSEYMNHYTALISKNNRWTLYNDSSVSNYNSEQVSGGYLFFYQLNRY